MRQDEAEGAPVLLPADPAPATAAPSRRAVLAALVGAGTIESSPRQVGIVGQVARGDMDLMALATRSAALATDIRTAVATLVAADTRFDQLAPPRPAPPVRDDARTVAATLAADLPHAGQPILGTPPSPRGVSGSVGLEHQAQVAAWDAQCVTIERRCGRRAALRKYDRSNRHLASAAAALAGVEATSREAAVAKARACVVLLDPHHSRDTPEWLVDLLRSTVRDVVATAR